MCGAGVYLVFFTGCQFHHICVHYKQMFKNKILSVLVLLLITNIYILLTPFVLYRYYTRPVNHKLFCIIALLLGIMFSIPQNCGEDPMVYMVQKMLGTSVMSLKN